MARGQRRKGQKRDVKGLWSGDRSCQGPHDPAARQLPSRQGFAPAPASPGGGGRRLPAGFGDPAFPPRGLITHRRRMQPRRRHSLWAPGGGGVPGLCSRAGPGGGGGSAARN